MKQRVTYVVTNPENFSPEQVEVAKNGAAHRLSLRGVHAAKEQRITLALDELPGEVCYGLDIGVTA
jgi:hypothetical protein